MTGTLLASGLAAPDNTNVEVVLAAVAVAAVAAAVAAVPVLIARRHRREGVAAAAVLWAVVSAACVVWAINRSWTDSAERQRDILSGDYDPRELRPPAATPWALWGGLSLAYAGLVGWSAVPLRARPRGD